MKSNRNVNRNASNKPFQPEHFDEYGQPVDEYGRAVDPNGCPYEDYDSEGNPPPRNTRRGSAVGSHSGKSRGGSRHSGSRTADTGKIPPVKKKPRRKRRGGLLSKLMLLLVLLIAAAIAGSMYLLSLYTYDDTNASALTTDQGVINIMLFGKDTTDLREQNNDSSRSDAMMILSVDREHSTLKLISLERDSYVNVPGYGMHKLTDAYSYGETTGEGERLVMQTINENFDMNLTEYITVDFRQMAAIIDAVGGIDVTLTENELAELNRTISDYCWENSVDYDPVEAAGEQHLNGLQAMNYGRIRKGNTGDDWMRMERQGIVLDSVFSKAKSNPITAIRFLNGLMPNITSSLSKRDFFYLGFYTIRGGIPNMEHIRLPLDGEWWDGKENGQSVIKFKDSVLTKHLHEYIYENITPVAVEA